LHATDVQAFNAPESGKPELTESVINKVPKYLTLERKEVRLPSAHIDELTRLVRRLNRQRKGKDERITENTLIRIAVSLLADFGERIEGNNENELLESLRKVIGEQ
jgi:RNA polymerase-interacting CarD/CdnL/TRCF family regulator